MFKNILISLLFSCLFISCNEVSDPQIKDKPIIKIGVLIPETGTANSNGESSKAAMNYLLENKTFLNQITGISLDYEVQLQYFDTQTKPELALQGLTKMYSEGIRSFIGPFTSAELQAVMNFAESNDLVLISPSSVTTSMSQNKKNVFRFITDDSTQAKAVSKYLSLNNIEYLVGLYRNDVLGNDLINLIVKNRTIGELMQNAFAYNTDLSDIISKVNDFATRLRDAFILNNSTAAYLATFSEGSTILEELSKNEELSNLETLRLIGSSAFANNSEVIKNPAASDFAIKTQLVCPIFGLDPDTKHLWEPIVNELKSRLNRNPEIFSLIACDALQILIRANLSAKPNDINDLKRKITEFSDVQGITGDLTLNENKDRKYGNFNFWVIRKNGTSYNWEILSTYDSETDEIR